MIGSGGLRPAGATVVLVVLAALWLPLAPTASAHDELVSSTPANGDTVAVARSLTLTFSERLIQTGYRVVVRGPRGPVDGDVRISGAAVVKRFAQPLPAGRYAVVWRVVSADGHPVSGGLSFTVRGPAASSASVPPSASSPSASSPAASSPAASPSPTSSASTGSASASDGGGKGRSGLALAGAAAVVVAAAAALGLARRSRSTPSS